MSRVVHNLIGDLVGCVKRTTATRDLLLAATSAGATAGLPSSARSSGAANAGVLRTPYKVRGFTLVELLVTLVILMMLTAVAVPVLAPALAGRRQREASREVTSYFTLARDSAMRTGRATGVMLERFTGLGNASAKALINVGQPPNPVPEMCLTLWQVEVPPPYSGDTLYSRALVVGGYGAGAITFLGTAGNPEGFELVRLGDYVKFNTQGHQYQIVGLVDGSGNPLPLPTTLYLPVPQSNSYWKIVPVGGTTALVPTFLAGVPYQIMRQPVKTSTPPLQLPEGIVIDLASSGITPPSANPFSPTGTTFCALDSANQPYVLTDSIPVIILFSPTGSIERVAYSEADRPLPDPAATARPVAQAPTAPIFFLLGLREKIPSAVNTNNENWRDPTSLWITLFPQTGLVTSTENVPNSNVTLDTSSVQNLAASRLAALAYARRLASEGQTLGGR